MWAEALAANTASVRILRSLAMRGTGKTGLGHSCTTAAPICNSVSAVRDGCIRLTCQADGMADPAWQQRIVRFYEQDFDDDDPQGSIARMRELLSERSAGDAEALFELAGVYDALGLEGEAIPLYRRAIEAGLEGTSALRASLQLASSLRNIGEAAEAVSILESMPDAGVDEGARRAFLALALHDEGRHGDALRTALLALIPTLAGYKRSLSAYAAALRNTAAEPGRS
jgi:tetratricopeptide (TPR) repeat protein